jgi:hypothetical protein
MKKLGFILLALLLVIGLTSCGLSQNVKTQEKQALAIAQSIPLPPTFYSSDTGHQMVAKPIKVKFTGTYATETGEPIFSVTFRYVDPHPYWGWYRFWHPAYTYWYEYDLVYPIENVPQGMNWATPADSNYSPNNYLPNNYSQDYTEFTLQGLQSHQSELVWK